VRQPTVSIQRVNFKAIAAVASIDTDGKVVSAMTFDHSVNKHQFIEYLKQLRADAGHGTFTLCLDNMRAHHSHLVREYCESNGIKLLFTPPYSSEYAPIERLWALAKVIFRRELLQDDKHKLKQCQVRKLVELSIDQSSQKALASHVQRCRTRMEEWLTEARL
jgi:transposase